MLLSSEWRAGIGEDSDGVACVKEEVEGDADEGEDGLVNEVFARTGEADTCFDIDGPSRQTVDEGERKIGSNGAAGSFTSAQQCSRP